MLRFILAALALLALALPVAAQHEIQQPKGTWQKPGEIQQPKRSWQQPGDEVVLDSCKKGAEGS